MTATAGERGGPPDRQAELGWRRAEELQVALAVLGVSDHELLGLPDGGCAGLEAAHPVAVALEAGMGAARYRAWVAAESFVDAPVASARQELAKAARAATVTAR